MPDRAFFVRKAYYVMHGMGDKTLFLALSDNGNPTIATVHKVLHAVELRLVSRLNLPAEIPRNPGGLSGLPLNNWRNDYDPHV